MGNSPSTSKSASQSSSQAHSQHAQNESPRSLRRDTKHPIQGTSVQPPASSGSRPKSLQHRPGGGGPGGAVSSGNSTASSSVTTAASSVASSAKPPVEVQQAAPGSFHEPAKPVAVPVPVPHAHGSPSSPRSIRSPANEDTYPYESSIMPHSSLQDMSYLTRPPRLPLPIEEEVHTPGSPIIAPTDAGQPLEDIEGLDTASLPRPSSNLSNSSVLEEEDAEELLVDKNRPTVPTRLEWTRGGDKVYVTGTIFQWNRKTRLHPVEGRPGVFAVTIHVLPGTHHIRFLVDGQMQTSPDLPTTVDFGNNLVNYIEVNPDDASGATAEPSLTAASKEPQQHPQSGEAASQEGASKAPNYRPVPPAEAFSNKIPKYLIDFDIEGEPTPAYQMAAAAIELLPGPPALPGFLGKPILNAATLIKDDNSVLNMPNYTVLNHLATSSIKNNILAVSATTRYKSKYVTTIMYKPTSADD